MTRTTRLPARDGRARLVTCLHLLPLPGSPGWGGDMNAVVDRALREAEICAAARVDGMILENTFDTPYLKRPAEAGLIAGMALAAGAVRRATDLPLGIQILAGANVAALDVAIACDLDFVRVEGFAYAHVADEGLIEADAGVLMRRRAHLGAGHIEIWADVKKKHSAHAITGDLSIREAAEGAVYYGVDGVIVTGGATGKPAALADVDAVRDLGVRTVVGSGVDEANVKNYAARADVLIVGSALKTGGSWRGAVEPERVRAFVARLRS